MPSELASFGTQDVLDHTQVEERKEGTSLLDLPTCCIVPILSYLPWHMIYTTIPTVCTTFRDLVSSIHQVVDLEISLRHDSSTQQQQFAKWLVARGGTCLRSLDISWISEHYAAGLHAILQALAQSLQGAQHQENLLGTGAVLQHLTVHLYISERGRLLKPLADVCAAARRLQSLKLLPVHKRQLICGTPYNAGVGATAEQLAAFDSWLSSLPVNSLRSLTIDSLAAKLAIKVLQHSNLQHLTHLRLRDLRAADAAPTTFHDLLAAVGSLRSLQELDLQDPAGMGASYRAWYQMWKGLTALTGLNIMGCSSACIDGRDAHAIHPNALGWYHSGHSLPSECLAAGSCVLGRLQKLQADTKRAGWGIIPLHQVATLTALTSLVMPDSYYSIGWRAEGLSHLTKLSQLQSLDMHSCAIIGTPTAAAALGRLTSLTNLDLSGNTLSLDMIAAVGRLTRLADLSLVQHKSAWQAPGPIDQDDPAGVAAWNAVRQQEEDAHACTTAWSHLSQLTQLTRLCVSRVGAVRTFDASYLFPTVRAANAHLQELLIDSAVKEAEQLQQLLEFCPRLRVLDASYSSKVSAGDLAAVARLARLQKLLLCRCKPMLRDAAVVALTQLTALQLLDLQENNITLAGAHELLAVLGSGELSELRLCGNSELTGICKRQLAQSFNKVTVL